MTNLCHTCDFIVEQRRMPFLESYKDGRHASQDKVAKLIRNHVDEEGWVLASPRFARVLAFLSHRKVIGPLSLTDPRLRKNNFYILDPIPTSAQQSLQSMDIDAGPQVGPEVMSKFDPRPWQLHRAVPSRPQGSP
jgi:hypothetical protein